MSTESVIEGYREQYGVAHAGKLHCGYNINAFKLALVELDRRLDAAGTDPLPIRAQGGFALMCHGLRRGAYAVTMDIDTVTPTPTPAQQACIDSLARDWSLPADWINNDMVFTMDDDATTQDDCDAMDMMLDARYVDIKSLDCKSTSVLDDMFDHMTHITVKVADLQTLARAKAYASLSYGQGRTAKDVSDLIEVSRAMGAESREQMRRAMPWLDTPEFAGIDDILDRVVTDESRRSDMLVGRAANAEPCARVAASDYEYGV